MFEMYVVMYVLIEMNIANVNVRGKVSSEVSSEFLFLCNWNRLRCL